MKNISIGLGALGLLVSVLSYGEEFFEETHIPHGPHHFSALLADTHLDGKGDNATLGLDYEFRVSPLFGLGTVLEHDWDYHNGETNAFVAGIALGFSF